MVQLNDQAALSDVIQGFWRLSSWEMDRDALARFLCQCVDLGVTTFDTAEIYSNGNCESWLGAALKGSGLRRGDIQLVSKTGIIHDGDIHCYDTRYFHIVEACKGSLQRLKTDHLDLYLIHRPDPCTDPWEVARAFEDLQREGLILAAGVSNYGPRQYEALDYATGGTLVTNQIEVNPLRSEHFRSGLVDLLGQKRVRPMVWSPLAGGKLFTGDGQGVVPVQKALERVAGVHGVTPEVVAYAWLLYHPVGFLPICGSGRIGRLQAALAAQDVKLTHHEWYDIYAASGENVLL